MIRRLAALAAALLLASAARAQEEKKAEPAATELDPKTKAAIAREVEKAKEQLRDEVRAEIQGAQSAAEFLGAVAEGPKLEFLELDGYLRMRGSLLVGLDLGAGVDENGYYYFPKPIIDPANRDTLNTANMRFRLAPTLNVSEHVRVRSQLDVFDNYAYGSSTSAAFDATYSPYPVPFYGSSRLVSSDDARLDRDPITPKRAWAEIQTPVGLLSFGRMPSAWGLGILTHAGEGIDDDFGDTVDRLQFALPPVQTPVGAINFVPILDFDDEGVLRSDPRYGPGLGQPFDADSADDARTYALKAARLDTDDELRRKLDAGNRSFNFGGYYSYRTQRNHFPEWLEEGYGASIPSGDSLYGRRRTYGHVLDLWARWMTARLRIEAEAVGVYGHIGNAFTVGAVSATDPTLEVKNLGRVLLRQWGGTLLGEYKAMPNKLVLGVEVGAASGDDAPGFGNIPTRLAADGSLPPRGSLEGPQFGLPGDEDIRNFRFNPAYRVDLVLWRYIIGQLTDAWYLKPKLRWDILPGLAFDAAVVYSQALYAGSTPSAKDLIVDVQAAAPGKKALGIEADTKLTYTSGDGFQLWAEWGVLQPLGGMGSDLSRAHVLNVGLAAKF